jgi:SGNH hydrolase-like domain, acetyltransferase AlgX
VLLLVTVVLMLVVAELVLRAVVRRAAAAGSHRYLTADPVLHHRGRPAVSTIVAGTPFSTNSLGLRDREYASPKPAGTFRILMLGDSYTEGGGLLLEQTIAKRSEAALNARGCGAVDVVNAGTASYSPILEYLRLQRLGPVLQPDLVVLNFDMTDVHDDIVRTATAVLDARGLPVAVPSDPIRETALLLPPPPRWLGPVGRPLNRLALYQAFRKSRAGQRLLGPVKMTPEALTAYGLIGDLEHDPMAITRDGAPAGLARGWALTERYLLGVRDVARAQGARFVLVIYPHPHQVSAEESPEGRRQLGAGAGLFASEAPFQRLEALGQREGFPVVNLVAVFRARRGEGPLFRPTDVHHTAAGAAVFADGLVAGLRALDVLPACLR